MRRTRRAWERAASGIGRSKLAFALTAGVLAVSLGLVSVVRVGVTWVDSLVASFEGGTHMVVYLESGAGPEQAVQVASTLEAQAAVAQASYVSPQDAMARLERVFGEGSDALLGVEPALLPASVEVSFAGGVPDPAAARAIEARLATVDAIEDIELTGDWIASLDAAARGVRTLGSVLFFLALAGSAFVIACVLELRLRGRRRERHLLEVLGASPVAARAPIVIEGVWVGLVGALGALAIAYAAWMFAHEPATALLGRLVDLDEDAGPAVLLPVHELLVLAGAGVGAGFVGGAIASRRGRHD